jgi:hypothetical protein
MVVVQYRDVQATFDVKVGEWKSAEDWFEAVLNDNLPDPEEHPYSTPMKTGGWDKVVLDEARKVYGDELKVIVFEQGPLPEEQEGVVQ